MLTLYYESLYLCVRDCMHCVAHVQTNVNNQDGSFSRGQFQHHSRQEINGKKVTRTPKNTLKANKKVAKAFRAFLDESKEYDDVGFETFTADKLNEALEGFWLSARKQKQKTEPGEQKKNFYKASTLENLRHGLNRFLKAPPNNRGFDIIKDREFNAANESFKAALRELKVMGNGEISHHPEIEEADLQKLYGNFFPVCTAQDPVLLQDKVQFDIRFYFFRRGSENMHGMTTSTFAIKTDVNTGRRFVVQVIDELNKNHNEMDRESYSAMMPELGNERCPVKSFETYLQHLHPNCESLWQRPRETIHLKLNDQAWYYNKCVGMDTLQSFMKNLSLKYKLSQVYTNHSVRVTGATILQRKNYAPSQIQAVTGHKSVSSLAIYQRVSKAEKMEMGRSLSENLMDAVSVGQQHVASGSATPQHAQVGQSQPNVANPTVKAQEGLALHALGLGPDIIDMGQTTQPQSPSSSQQQALQELLPDLNLSPFLRDLEEDPFFDQISEQQTQVSMTSTNTMNTMNTEHGNGQMIATQRQDTRTVSLKSPRQRSSMPSFSGCTIHNLVVNVYPRPPQHQ